MDQIRDRLNSNNSTSLIASEIKVSHPNVFVCISDIKGDLYEKRCLLRRRIVEGVKKLSKGLLGLVNGSFHLWIFRGNRDYIVILHCILLGVQCASAGAVGSVVEA